MIDVNIKGVLYGIAAALPVFREQGSGHFVNLASTAAYVTSPNQAVYSGTQARHGRRLGGAATGGGTAPQGHHHLTRLRADRFVETVSYRSGSLWVDGLDARQMRR